MPRVRRVRLRTDLHGPGFDGAAIGIFWFLLKVAVIIYLMIWFGWKVMIPIGIAAIVINALLGMVHGAWRTKLEGVG